MSAMSSEAETARGTSFNAFLLVPMLLFFGLLVAAMMALVFRWHRSNRARYPAEVDHLLAIARSDEH